MKSLSVRVFLAIGFVCCLLFVLANPNRMDAQTKEPTPTKLAAVEDDMHEFMEYYFQPAYLRLKDVMAAQPTDTKAWKIVKSEALILAEGGNLLHLRQPKEDAAAWQQLSDQVRDLGGQLYQAGKKKNYPDALTHYKAMLIKCNACHEQFAGGEHQLAP